MDIPGFPSVNDLVFLFGSLRLFNFIGTNATIFILKLSCNIIIIKVIFPPRRDTSLDRDETSISSVLCQFAREVPADIYVLAHATAPFLCAASIKRGLEAVSSGGYDSAFAAKKVQDFLWGEGKPLNYDPANIPRTQDLPGLYAETSGFYIYWRSVRLYQTPPPSCTAGTPTRSSASRKGPQAQISRAHRICRGFMRKQAVFISTGAAW